MGMTVRNLQQVVARVEGARNGHRIKRRLSVPEVEDQPVEDREWSVMASDDDVAMRATYMLTLAVDHWPTATRDRAALVEAARRALKVHGGKPIWNATDKRLVQWLEARLPQEAAS